ncbi:MAG: Ku protein [Bacillota bacterium]
MRPILRTAISFGLVHIPVKLYAATESKEVHFHQLHKACYTPIRYQKVCPTCEVEVGPDDIIRGYEYAKGAYVTVSDEDLEQIPLDDVRALQILDFVALTEVDPIRYVKSYFTAPDGPSLKPYRLLYEAMERTGKVAVARGVMRAKEHLMLIRNYRGTLLLETLFYGDEIRDPAELGELEGDVRLDEREVDMARMLVDNLTRPFEPERYTSAYRETVQKMLQAKIQGREIAVPARPQMPQVADLMEALRASIAAAREGRGADAPPPPPPEGWSPPPVQ